MVLNGEVNLQNVYCGVCIALTCNVCDEKKKQIKTKKKQKR